LKFLETMEASILSDHRIVPPYGLDGGQDGATGCNLVLRADGGIDELNGTDRTTIEAGECIIIETPGGGGYGSAKN
nr:hydantoinase B/oxoprolinase family protein [Pseudomonadales bacterium]